MSGARATGLVAALRMLRRELRGGAGRLALFAACLAVGTAAVTGVAAISGGLEDGIREEARRMLGGDVAVQARRPLGPELAAALDAWRDEVGPVDRADLREAPSIVSAGSTAGAAPATTKLVELRVVEGPYPFYGGLVVEPPLPAGTTVAARLDAERCLVDAGLLDELGLVVGDALRVGGVDFDIAGAIVEEPDRLGFTFNLGPRVYLARPGLERTPLAGFGSRVRHSAVLRIGSEATAEDAARLADRIRLALPDPGFHEVETFAEAQPALRTSIRRVGRFLGLVGLLSLLIGGVGIAQSTRAWVAARVDEVAVLRCLGARPNEVAGLFLAQAVLLALAGSLLGVALGTAGAALAPVLAGRLLPGGGFDPVQPVAIARGLVLGLGTALVFAGGPLLALRRVPPARVFRRAEGIPTAARHRVAEAVLVGAGIVAAAAWQAGSLRDGGAFAGIVAATVLALAACAFGVVRLAAAAGRRLPPGPGRTRVRLALAGLARPGGATIAAVTALGTGAMLVFTMRVVDVQLSGALAGELPEDAPTTFFVDVQPDQWEAFRAMLLDAGGTMPDSVPFVVARIDAIDGRSVHDVITDVDAGTDEAGRRRWALTREQRLSYARDLPRGNTLLEAAGDELWSRPDRAEVSLESDFARRIGADVGTELRMNVQGVPLDLLVTSVRRVDWRSFAINFFMQVEPGVLEEAPQVRVATIRLDEGEVASVRAAVARDYPNVVMLHVEEILARVARVLGRLAAAVQVLGALVVAAGLVILGAGTATAYARRAGESALLKTLGATRTDVAIALALEFAAVGLAAATIGLVAGTILAAQVLERGLELDFVFPAGAFVLAAGATLLLATAAGLLSALRALLAPPAATLRAE